VTRANTSLILRRPQKLVSEFVVGMTLDDYLKSALLQSGVERQFEIIGEALGQLAKVDQQLAGRITDFQKIVSCRNVLIHGCADVDDEWVWDIVETRLHILREEVEKLIADRSDKGET
jgi:uncharacterized protein with HEPN domain